MDARPWTKTWIETFVADGAFNGFDASDPNYSCSPGRSARSRRSTSPGTSGRDSGSPTRWQPWAAREFRYDRETAAFIAPTLFHPKVSKLMFTGREHVFRSVNGGMNLTFAAQTWRTLQPLDRRRRHRRERRLRAAGRRLRRLEADGHPGPPGRLNYGPLAACPT